MPSSNYHRIAHYVTNTDRNVFALRNLPEEVAAVLFAYYSRSADGLRENLLKLLDEGDLDIGNIAGAAPPLAQAQEKARAFHEKWVVGYGHASVAEHAVVKLAVENVSILASKLIEDSRLASYTEKSTRYVQFDPSKAHYPATIMASPGATVYRKCIESLMNAYTGWMDSVFTKVKAQTKQTEKQTPRSYEAACRATSCDILRYLLPAATHTNIGITINARALESMITKLLSQPLIEGQILGRDIKSEAMYIVPTLLKYADPNSYRAGLAEVALPPDTTPVTKNSVRLIGDHLNESQALDQIALPDSGANLDLAALLSERGKYDASPRQFERVFLTFEITLDYGAYRDIQRHRMATLITEPLSTVYGYETPAQIEEFGLKTGYDELMALAAATHYQLTEFGPESQYCIPLAYRVRTRMTANLRELFHFIELRTGRGGHPSYRKIALGVYEEIARIYPTIAAYIRPNKGVFSLTRE